MLIKQKIKLGKMRNYESNYISTATSGVSNLGKIILAKVHAVGCGLFILFEAFFWLIHLFKRRGEVRRQLIICGINSFLVTAIVALFTGMILALQAGLLLKEYSQEVQIGTLVSQTMCREMGPFMTALIIAASVGSAMAAELATMKVSEEISALEVMSINPIRFLIMPRLFAMMIMVPTLTIFTNVIGILGGMLIGYTQLGVSAHAYYENAISMLNNKEIYVGLFKSLIFGIEIVGISCYQGLFASNGAVGVGRATRTTVVSSFLLILVTGYIITRIFY